MSRDEDPAARAGYLDRIRGAMLGFTLGDAREGPGGVLEAGIATQLLCFGIEGCTRLSVRAFQNGIGPALTVPWHATCRWAAVQGLGGRQVDQWRNGSEPWPDGWLQAVPLMAVRRGSAPAIARALQADEVGSFDRPSTTSSGAHALSRALPVGALTLVANHEEETVAAWAAEVACQSHGHAEAWAAASMAAVVLARLVEDGGPEDGVRRALERPFPLPGTHASSQLVDVAAQGPSNVTPEEVRRLCPSPTALSVLAAALAVAQAFPEPDRIGAALEVAGHAADGRLAAAMTGALLGAANGASRLPVGLVSRLEAAWVVDTLARDLVLELLDHPAGSGWGAVDPHWWQRYPGW